jgi:hypothetical protein
MGRGRKEVGKMSVPEGGGRVGGFYWRGCRGTLKNRSEAKRTNLDRSKRLPRQIKVHVRHRNLDLAAFLRASPAREQEIFKVHMDLEEIRGDARGFVSERLRCETALCLLEEHIMHRIWGERNEARARER